MNSPGLHVIIPAGGAGTRLWPLSRRARPKFLLDVTGSGRTLLQATVDRMAASASSVTIVTGAAHREGVLEQLPEFASRDDRTLLVEPSGRDSMAAIGLAAYVVRARSGDDAVVGSFAADHVVARPDLLERAVASGIGAARQGYVVTVGIGPTGASTAYGYIQPDRSGELPAPSGALAVRSFVEKPDGATAERYVEQGYLWNAGMFLMTAGVLAGHLARLMPDMHERLEAVAAQWGGDGFEEALALHWPHLTRIAIDHAIAEPAAAQGGVAVVPADEALGWTDLGDFDALNAVRGTQGALGDAVRVDSDGAGVFSTTGQAVALVGVPDVNVVVAEDAVAVIRSGMGQSVKAVVDALGASGRDDLL